MTQAENTAVGTYISQIRSAEIIPWSDWMTKHVNDVYGTARGVGTTAVKPEEIVQIKENLR